MARNRAKLTGWTLVSLTTLLTVVTVALAATGIGSRTTQVSGKKSVVIPAATLGKGSVQFFSYRDDAGKEIRFILGRDQAGQVHGAFDACQRCAQYGKGYTSSHGYLVCRFCGNRYRVDSRTGIASCAPIELPVHEAGKTITVDTTELKRQRNLF